MNDTMGKGISDEASRYNNLGTFQFVITLTNQQSKLHKPVHLSEQEGH